MPLPETTQAATSDLVVLVFGHRRSRSLRYVLEGLRRQDALPFTQVWLDGHQEYPELLPKVAACQALEAVFPEARWIKYGARYGLAKLLIAALEKAVQSHRHIVILEDDCFPAEDAVEVFRAELDAVESDDKVFSVYGHYFGDPDEGAFSTAFQCWGWATTAAKVKPVVAELRRLWNLAEPDFVQWIQERMTPAIRQRMEQHRPGSETLTWRFCWDATVGFLAASAGQVHKRTPHQVIWNFGVGLDSGHFGGLAPRFFQPPFNMISEDDLRRRFNLPLIETEDPYRVEFGQPYHFGAESSHRRLLGKGWSIPEEWGTWSEGDESFLHLSATPGKGLKRNASHPDSASGDNTGERQVVLTLHLRAFTGGQPPDLAVAVAVNGHDLTTWRFAPREWRATKRIEIPVAVWDAQSPAQIKFCYAGARTPADVTPGSPDTRRIAVGLAGMEVAVENPEAAGDGGTA